MRGKFPEEDGVDHRVEPQPWLSDGAANGSDGGPDEEQPRSAEEPPPYAVAPAYPADGAADETQHYPAAPPYAAPSAYPADFAGDPAGGAPEYPNGHSADTGAAPQGGEIGMPFPYPAQPPPAHGLGARLNSFLVRSKTGAAQSARPDERSSRPMAARVTAQFQARAKPDAAKQAKPKKAAAASVAPKGPQSTRKAQLILSRIEPWSVMKFSFMISLVGWVILFVAVSVLYFVLSKLGVFHAIQSTISSVTSGKNSPGVDAGGGWFSASRILGYTMLVGAVNVVLITALATVAAVIYNLVTHIAGGIEVTLKETD
ncbi:MAG: DUF3566 domain-containing protein [Streptosporangiaceae bacterium]|jgi:hypothetical protein